MSWLLVIVQWSGLALTIAMVCATAASRAAVTWLWVYMNAPVGLFGVEEKRRLVWLELVWYGLKRLESRRIEKEWLG
jgi:hypothetical protein